MISVCMEPIMEKVYSGIVRKSDRIYRQQAYPICEEYQHSWIYA